jgi:glycosyltransferase involved in cell wall biosynthesis
MMETVGDMAVASQAHVMRHDAQADDSRLRIAMMLPGGVDRSGVDRVIPSRLWLIERLARRHDLHVFATAQETDPGDWKLLGAKVHNVGTARGTARRLLRVFGHEHRRAKFDVVHAFFGWAGMHAALVGWRHRVPVAFHASGGEFVCLGDIDYGMRCTWRGRIGLRVAIAGAQHVTVASEPMQRLASGLSISSHRVPIGVAVDQWPVRPPVPRAGGPLRLLHVGDLRPVKDQQTLMAAAVRLREAGIAFTLDVVGLDTMDGALQRSAAAAALGARVRWHGVLRRGPLRALMEQADIHVVSSRHEAGPLVVLEAAIAGVPTVGTNVGHVAELAPRGAVAVPVGDAESMADAIARLARDETLRVSLATEAQQWALGQDADATAGAFETVYRQICKRA